MTSPEPLRGSVQPKGRPARLLGADEVEALERDRPTEDVDEPDEEIDDDRRPD